jgi:gamma-glutamyltranspeptidase/glutathione hydrolase
MPEGPTGLSTKPGWTSARFMVAAAHPLAAKAGERILRAGGSALDAAVAVQMVLALVEPQSSGLGGGAFLLHWDGRELQAWDGRETAPAAADERLFLRADGRPLPFEQASVGGLAVGVPGAVRMLEAAHLAHGRLPWARLFEPAIALAEGGFPVGARMHALLESTPALRDDPLARAYFHRADGQPVPVGEVLKNPALAAVLRAIAARGSAALHSGPVAADIAARVRQHPRNPGRLTVADLEAYAPQRREPLCTLWKQSWRVCGFPPPSSGHLATMQILGLLERATPVEHALVDGVPGPDWLHVYAEAARLAFADRARFVADPDFAPAPAGRWTSLLDDAYLRQRASLIGPRSMGTAAPGMPAGDLSAWAPQPDQPEGGTSHLSVVDGEGRAVALTSSVEAAFGARLMSDGGTGLAGGFLLNNQMTDFSFLPADEQGRPVANRVQPGKRPRSSMTPTLVFDARDGRLLMSLGSAGGAAIVHFTAKTLVGTLDWGLDLQRAVDLPNFANLNGPTQLEAGRFPLATRQALEARGHAVAERALPSGTQAIRRVPAGWAGAADPRREGIAIGD